MNVPKIDIIVPVYNVEPYLRKCVDSLLNQTYDDYIISLVDDGSPDECPVICDEYAINYPEKSGFIISRMEDYQMRGIMR